MKKHLLFKALLCPLLSIVGLNSMWAEEVVYKTALFGSSYNSAGVSSYTSSFTSTNDNFTVNLANFNNNNNGWSYVKTGNKSAASQGTIITAAAIDKKVTKVVVTIDAITASNVNSIQLFTGSSANTFSTQAEGTFKAETGAQAVSIKTPTANQFYKITFNCSKGSSNGLVTVSKVEFYYDDAEGSGSTTKYGITVDVSGLGETGNGFSVNGTYYNSYQYIANAAAAGETITLTASPEPGYKATADCWNVYDANMQSISVSGSGNVYSFTMPAGNVSISPVFVANSTEPTEPTKLSKPTNLSTSNITATSADLSWDAVANASSYTLTVYDDEFTEIVKNQSVNTTTYSLSGLTADTHYNWYVTAIGDGDNYSNSKASDDDEFTTLAQGGDDNSSLTLDKDTYSEWSANDYLSNNGSVSNSPITLSATGTNSAGPVRFNSNSYIQIYQNTEVTFSSASGYKITKIVFNCTAQDKNTYGPAKLELKEGEPGQYSYSGYDGTWTGNTSSVTLKASAQARVNSITITYEAENGDTPSKTTPNLSFANATYNATMGEAFTAPTLNNPQEVTVSYSSSETSVATVNASTGAIKLVGAGTTKITASFAGDETYNANSASYDLVVAAVEEPALTTMDEIYAKAQEVNGTETDVKVTLNNWVVSGVNGANAYVTDGTKGFIIYKSGHNFVAGDILSGTVSAKIKYFNGAAEFTTITSTTEGLTVTKGGSVSEQNIAIADLAGVNTGALIAYENLTYHLNGTSAEFSDGENVIIAYKGIMNTLPELIEGKTYDVKGVFLMYGTKKEILPRSAEDIVLKENLNKYTVTIETPENGTLTIRDGEKVINGGDEVTEGTVLTIECTPTNADYRFKNWQYQEEGGSLNTRYTNPQDYKMPSANVQFKANFELIPTYTIKWSVNGVIAKTDENVKQGATLTTPEVSAINGKNFTGWVTTATVDADATPSYVTPSTPNTAEPNEITYYAVFADGEGGGTPSLTKITDARQVEEGTYALISYDEAYYLPNTAATGNAPSVKAVTKTGDDIDFLDEMKWTLTINGDGAYVFKSNASTEETELYLWGSTTNEGIRINTTSAKANPFNTWELKSTNDYGLVLCHKTDNTTYRYLSTYGASDWRNYTSTNTTNLAANIYKYSSGGTYSDFTTIPEVTYASAGTINFVATTGDGNYYATFSNNATTFFPADGVEVQTVEVGDITQTLNVLTIGTETVETLDKTGYFVPANTGVLIKASKTSAPYYTTNKIVHALENNSLQPASKSMEEISGCKFYKLAYNDYTNKTGLGFWYGADEGAAFDCKTGLAYLAVPVSSNSNPVKGYAFDGEEVTAIKAIDADNQRTSIYDLSGRKVSKAQKGIYIVNGRKVLK